MTRITKAILNDENSVLPLSVYLDGEYGQEDIFIGAPAIVNRQGIQQVIEIPLNDAEKEKMNHSADTLRKITQDAMKKLDEETN